MIKYKRNEDKIIAGIKAYVDATYDAHYNGSNGRDVCDDREDMGLSLIHISEPTRQEAITYAVF